MTTKTLIYSLLFISLVIGGFYFYANRLRNQNNLSTSYENTISTPQDNATNPTNDIVVTYSLPKGKQVYNVSHGKETKGPKMTTITYDPLTFKSGDKQTFSITLPKEEVVSSGVLFITTDNKENQKITLSKNTQDNTWTGEWTTNDSIDKRYTVRIYLVGPSGTYDNTMYFL